MGIIASVPQVIENGVSHMDLLNVVRYAYNTLGISLVHFPLKSSNLTFKPLIMDLFVSSSCSFPQGQDGVKYLLVIPNFEHYRQKAFQLNWSPLSEMRTLGTPKQVTMFLHMNLLTFVSRMLASRSPAKSASYFASFLDARKPYLNDFSTQIPSSEINTMPTPTP